MVTQAGSGLPCPYPPTAPERSCASDFQCCWWSRARGRGTEREQCGREEVLLEGGDKQQGSWTAFQEHFHVWESGRGCEILPGWKRRVCSGMLSAQGALPFPWDPGVPLWLFSLACA